MKSIQSWTRRFHREESGAVFLLSLAAILIIMMLAWVIIDAGKSARDKVELQASADAAAFSQSSVKARAANMIAYTNVAKRSIIGIQSMYLGMYYGYVAWVAWRWSKCKWYRPDICIDAAINTAMLAVETVMDYRKLTGIFGIFGSGAAKTYHAKDIKALDNYQQYMMWLAPWWSFSEGIVRGMRNGATTTASFPPPPGVMIGPFATMLSKLRLFMADTLHLGGLFTTAGMVDVFPYERGTYWGDLLWDNMLGDGAYMVEHLANSLHHKKRSSMGAATWRAYGLGMLAFPLGFWQTTAKMGDEGRPWVFRKFPTQAAWTTSTSNLVYAYGNRPEKFKEDRQKYMFMTKEYKNQLGVVDSFGYRTSGAWSMARAEMTYQDGDPNPFRPSWTARLRPVALPGEWQEAGFDLNQSYHDVLPYMALSSLIGMGSISGVTSALQDFANMVRATRGFGHSTIEGIAK